ncbi:MAG: response regulator [Ruminococcus sp.]
MEKRTVDVLMTDIRMPSMTGLELLEKVYQNGWSPAAIVLSSFNEFELVRSAMQLGAEDYLFKPTMMPTDILESVQRVLEKKKKQRKRQFRLFLKRNVGKISSGRKSFQGEIRNFRGAVAGIRDNGVCNCQCPVDEISGLSSESVW